MQRVAYLGPCGTYSEDIAQRLYGSDPNYELIGYDTIDKAIRAVESEAVDLAVVPIENSLGGSINITQDIIAHEAELFIVQEATLAIRHCLFLPKGEVTEIVSHDQALSQCRHYIEQHYPDVKVQAVKSTGSAVEMAASGAKGVAAIGSRRAGEVFGIEPDVEEINDVHNNRTRFIVLARQPRMPEEKDAKTSIVCQINGQRPGALYELLYEFKQHDVNLTRIESRPARTALGEYIFFLDLEGTPKDPSVEEVLRIVQEKTNWFKNLGYYPGENFQ